MEKNEDTTTVVENKRKLNPGFSGAREYVDQIGESIIEIEKDPNGQSLRKKLDSAGVSRSSSFSTAKKAAPSAHQSFHKSSVSGKKSMTGTYLLAACALGVGWIVYGPSYGIPAPNLEGIQALVLSKAKFFGVGSAREIASANRPTQEINSKNLSVGKTIYLRLNVVPLGNKTLIAINGKQLTGKLPGTIVNLDSPLELTVDTPGYKPLRREFVLDSKQVSGLAEWLVDVQLDPIQFGFITIHTTPSADAACSIIKVASSTGKLSECSVDLETYCLRFFPSTHSIAI